MTSNLEKINALVASMPKSHGKKLSRFDQCAILAAAKRQFPQALLAKAFGVSETTISWISHCLDPEAEHYRAAAREFRRLGEAAFLERYLSDDVEVKLRRIALAVPAPGDIRRPAPNPLADTYAGFHWVEFLNGSSEEDEIRFVDGQWAFRGEIASRGRWVNQENERPLRTSWQAYDAMWRNTGQPAPRPRLKPHRQ